MAGIVSQWMRPIFFYMLTSIWKRKPLLLAIIMVASFTVIALQYNSVSGQNKSNTNTDHHQNELKFNGGNNKEKVDNLSPPRRNLSALGPIKSNPNNQNDVPKSASSGGGLAAGDSVGAAPPSLSANKFGIFYGNEPVFGKKFNQIEDKLSDDRLRKADSSNNNNNKMSKEKSEFFVPQLRLVHLDLKGAPPKISYLTSILPILKAAGANGILIEYEDMFPYWDYLEGIAAKNAYSKEEIKLFLQSAEEHNMEVIPLVPTFGHMEFVLKLAKFRKLREYDPYPMALCPSRNESFILVQHMIDQIMLLHPSVKWLHIGCDEVFHMGYCDKCRNIDRDILYLSHVTKIAKYVRDRHHVIPIVWDDMLRNIMPDRLRDSKIGQLVEPMIWTYVKDIYRFIPYPTFSYFSELFANVWAASAFKGAFGETLTAPNVKMHLENNQAWLDVMAEQHRNFKSFRGIAVSGWQRYDHLGTLCELLPSGLPSLIVDLITLKNGHYESPKVFKEFDKIMHCSSASGGQYSPSGNEVDFESDPYLYSHASSCMFPGSSIFRMTQSVADAVKRVNDYIYDVTIHKAWLTEYNVRHNVSNPYRVDEGLEQHSNVHYILTSAFRSAASSLREAFDEYTVNEWIEQNIYPYLLKMEKLLKDGENLKKAKVWPRRPYEPLPDMKRFGL